MPGLRMLSLKENGFTTLDCEKLPVALEWLIATDNQITAVPHLGGLHRIRKLMLSHNKLGAAA